VQNVERGRIAVWAVCAVAVVVLGARWMMGQGAAAGRSAAFSTGSSRSTTAQGSGQSSLHGEPSVVQIAGMVRHPGVYRLPFGARVYEALREAGGAIPGSSSESLNLAARVSDGQRIVVPRRGAVAPASSDGAVGQGSGASTTSGPVSLNQATAQQLDALDGIGPALAARIVEWRQSHGGFASVDDLDKVPGIGPAKLAALRQLVVP
jgi:competence protein ComEA